MRTRGAGTRILWIAAPLLLLLLSPARSFAGELIFSQLSDNLSSFGQSNRAPGGPVNAEVARAVLAAAVVSLSGPPTST